MFNKIKYLRFQCVDQDSDYVILNNKKLGDVKIHTIDGTTYLADIKNLNLSIHFNTKIIKSETRKSKFNIQVEIESIRDNLSEKTYKTAGSFNEHQFELNSVMAYMYKKGLIGATN